MRLAGLSALITGASQGLGVVIARQFVIEGANVVITARSRDMLDDVRRSLLPLCDQGQQVVATPCDISRTDEVDALMASVVGVMPRLDILVNNASIFGPMGRFEEASWSEWADTVNVNLLGTVYVCRAAIPHLKRAPRGKIINVSGGGAARPLPTLCAYAASKAAIVRFSEELAEGLKPQTDVNCIAPGPLNTRLVDQAIAAGPGRLGQALYDEIVGIRTSGGTPFELAASLCTYLASRQSDGVTGKLISARHDEWSTLHERIPELSSTEIYTMRRLDPSTIQKFRDQYTPPDQAVKTEPQTTAKPKARSG